MDIQKLVAAEEELLISLRRHFHEHPELSEQEFRTLEYIDERLDAWGIPNVEIPFGGIFATIDSGKPGRTILLRADIDALPIEESLTNLAGPKICVSQNPGVSHACGHDAHTAMLLVAAKILAEHKDEWSGKVICMFEQAEEMGDRGIRDLLPYLETNGIHIDACYGTHTMYALPAGKVAVLPGAAMAGAMFFCVKINGKSGHGSMPHLAKNPIDAFTTFDGELASYRMRSVAPNHMLTYSFGMVRAGDTPNVIPETLTFSGTARFFDDEDGLAFRKEFRRILAYVTEMQGMTAEILLDQYFPVTVNNAECVEAARTAIAEVSEDLLGDVEPWMATETFALTEGIYPGVFTFTGILDEEAGTGANHHTPEFDVPDKALVTGVTATLAYTLYMLAHMPEITSFEKRDLAEMLSMIE